TGAVLKRVPDVGNPWLDAGIVPFSTMGFNTHPELWRKWFPADLVTECFPGQFRNWFYSLLSLATMMRSDQSDAEDKKPFKTLLGHRLVMNEAGKPMHKSDGTAIWFEEAAEQIGVDTMRWMYLQQNPAQDLRFGTRHPEQKVTLETVDGPRDTTIDGVPTCKVESGPADEVRRQVLLPLWNSYSFFVNYARLDGFDPSLPEIPFAERPQIDQWILTNLQAAITQVRTGLESFDTPAAAKAVAEFVDDLSNWYIRRNRRRFWRSRSTGAGVAEDLDGMTRNTGGRGREIPDVGSVVLTDPTGRSIEWDYSNWDRDKLAAYQTLHRVLVNLTKLLAPMLPFLAERMYQNLVRLSDPFAPESVHLCDFPTEDNEWQARELLEPMRTAQRVVQMGHRLRESINQRVRQPLGEVRVASRLKATRDKVEALADVIADELNVKKVTVVESLGELVTYKYRANPASLGKRYGKLLNKLREVLATMSHEQYVTLSDTGTATIRVEDQTVELIPDDVSESVENASGWASASDGPISISVSTELTPELIREGMSRDFVRHVQQMRKDADLEIEQRIRIRYATQDAEAQQAIREWGDFICGETLADEITSTSMTRDGMKSVAVGNSSVDLAITVTS
ncbi:MAG: DUF5915 domain-containing protein, partial [Planctomycetaceae bacterium]|nr:DUF5915 domain-containing protein [Planctomycetaceae bacterium]